MNYLNIDRLIQWDKVNQNIKIEYIHLKLNRLLNQTLNFYVLEKKSKLKTFLHKNINDLKVSQEGIRSFFYIKNFFESRLNIRIKVNHYDISNFKNFLLQLVALNRILREYLELVNKKRYIVNPYTYYESKYKEKGLIEVIQFSKNIKNIDGIKEVFIHGSLSTFDYTYFSDFDTLIIIDKELEKDIDYLILELKRLLNISKYFYLFDPYQHHRYFFVFENDIFNYNNTILPVEVLNYSTSLKGETRNFYVYHSKISSVETLIGALNKLIYYTRDYSTIKNLWNFKYFIATILFIPVLFLEVNNIYVYKKYSFSLIRKFIPENLKNFLDKCSALRKNWKYDLTIVEKLIRKTFLNIRENPILYESFMKKYSQNVDRQYIEPILKQTNFYVNFFYKNIISLF